MPMGHFTRNAPYTYIPSEPQVAISYALVIPEGKKVI